MVSLEALQKDGTWDELSTTGLPQIVRDKLSELPAAFFEGGPEVVKKALESNGIEGELMWRIVRMVSKTAVRTLGPFVE